MEEDCFMRYIWIDEYLLSKAGVTGENTGCFYPH